ncbi:hypothetical protein SAMN04487783_1372 [Agrococcus baldri]|uniref:ABC-2 family transporter protein n=1 Tax=Agrococcus baldri TaxID=153730 RepID=A0AA94KZG7_9MICO|nr:hypothetical protein [Agrococcus baldri]SFS10189.1 hypothetical protein SAMN04487783_1372 [Agrococcus baldri]
MTAILMKHEAIRTRGFLLVILGAAVALGAVGSLMAITGWPVLAVFGTVLGFIGAFGLVPAMLLASAVDYWRTSYGRVGYFTQTLPVRGSRIFWTKFAWASLMLLVGLVLTVVLWLLVMVASAQSLFATTPTMLLGQVGDVLAAAYQAAPLLVAVGAPVISIVMYGFNLVMLFAAASIGSERRLQRLGWGGPVLVWFVLYAIVQVVMFVAVLAIPFGLGVDASGEFGVVPVDMLTAMLQNTSANVMPVGFLPAMALAIPLLLWRTVHSWNRRVSLA